MPGCGLARLCEVRRRRGGFTAGTCARMGTLAAACRLTTGDVFRGTANRPGRPRHYAGCGLARRGPDGMFISASQPPATVLGGNMRTDSLHWLASWPCSGVAGGTVAHRRSIRQMPNQEVVIEHPGQGRGGPDHARGRQARPARWPSAGPYQVSLVRPAPLGEE